MKKFYVTTPIYYVNAKPHIGHTYTTIAADILARYHRFIGEDTFFATGTDEHGAKIAQKAASVGKNPKNYADEVAAQFQMSWDEMNISNDRFIRTTDEKHKKAVQTALQYMYDKGDIYKDKYEGLYCTGCEQFKNKKDLVDGKCSDHQTIPEEMSEETYVFKMSKYSSQLLKMIKNDELCIRPLSRKNEILSFYKNEGLKDVSFSRQNVTWGIPLPWDKSHTAYVWSDAFLNYLTILGWKGNGPKLSPEAKKFWPADVQLMSKDILRVHSTIWPAMLLSLGIPVQKLIFVHGFFLVDGQKMSKSIGNVIAPEDLVAKYGVDATRYLLISSTPFGHDGDIGWEKFDEKYNADLANGIGNLVSRSITLWQKLKNANIDIPKCVERPKDDNLKKWGGRAMAEEIAVKWKKYNEYLNRVELHKALDIAIDEQHYLDGYLSENAPWKMIKEGNTDAAIILYNVMDRVRLLALMLWPFMPEISEKSLQGLGFDINDIFKKHFYDLIKFGLLAHNARVQKIDSLFPRLDMKK